MFVLIWYYDANQVKNVTAITVKQDELAFLCDEWDFDTHI